MHSLHLISLVLDLAIFSQDLPFPALTRFSELDYIDASDDLFDSIVFHSQYNQIWQHSRDKTG